MGRILRTRASRDRSGPLRLDLCALDLLGQAEEVTSTQRRADALGLLAECALDADLDRGATADRYQVVVHVEVEARELTGYPARVERSRSGAVSPTARHAAATPTTSRIGPMAAARRSTIWSCCAAGTTGSCTKGDIKWSWDRAMRSRSSGRMDDGSTGHPRWRVASRPGLLQR